jgi:pectate lyase
MKIQVEVWQSVHHMWRASSGTRDIKDYAGYITHYTMNYNDHRQRRVFGEQSADALKAGQCVVTYQWPDEVDGTKGDQ